MIRRGAVQAPSIEEVRKVARVLVIDDHALPAQRMFERDGYHFERWPQVKNLSQLTDGHYQLIMLDVEGVGLKESPDLQGLGILRHIKKTNPAQSVLVYSAKTHNLSSSEYAQHADAVLDKGMTYVEYKDKVDEILLRRASPGYFVAAMNRELGDGAVLAPDAVKKAVKAFERRDPQVLSSYLRDRLPDKDKVDLIIQIVSVGIQTVQLLHS